MIDSILMVSLDFPPTVGGISAHVYELSKKLKEMDIKVYVLTRKLSHQSSYDRVDGIEIFRIELKFLGFTYGYQINKELKKLCTKLHPSIIHIHGMRPLEFLQKTGIPIVYTNHTSGYLKRVQKGGYRVKLLKKIFQKPDLVLAPSRELLDIPFEIAAKKIYIPNGVDINKYKRDDTAREVLRKEFGFTKDDKVGIVTRRLVKKNGVINLAKATKYIKNKNLKLVIIGNGEEFDDIKKEFEVNFKDRYIMLGSKTHDEIVRFYSMADFSVLPSLMEATSISGLEAMASSLAIVGTNVGGIPELIDEDKNGYLCKPNDPQDLATALDRLLEQDLQKFGLRSLKKVKEEFDWKIIAQKTLEAYRMVA